MRMQGAGMRIKGGSAGGLRIKGGSAVCWKRVVLAGVDGILIRSRRPSLFLFLFLFLSSSCNNLFLKDYRWRRRISTE
jgi:hypothetical protein